MTTLEQATKFAKENQQSVRNLILVPPIASDDADQDEDVVTGSLKITSLRCEDLSFE